MEHNQYPTIQIKPVIICFWLLDKIALPFIPRLKKVVHWCKYQYYKTSRRTLVKLFDDYAENFEDHLLDTLEYTTPVDMANFLATKIKLNNSLSIVADLGCGTGLVGQELKQRFSIERLIGVDLSWKMLKKSKSKAIYNELHNSDILEYLKNSPASKFDLITACDVLIYIGDLNAVTKKAHQALQPGGSFAFSVERNDKSQLKLTPALRYQHSLNYLQKLSQEHGFNYFAHSEVNLRKENKELVPGYIVIMQK